MRSKARSFFFVCAGLFLLVLSYHLGARSAGAQVAGPIRGGAFAYVAGLPSGWRFSGANGRMFHAMEPTGLRYDPSEPIPGSAAVIATDPAGFSVMLEDGDVFQYDVGGWKFVGNLLGGATATMPQSFGQVRTRYLGRTPEAARLNIQRAPRDGR